MAYLFSLVPSTEHTGKQHPVKAAQEVRLCCSTRRRRRWRRRRGDNVWDGGGGGNRTSSDRVAAVLQTRPSSSDGHADDGPSGNGKLAVTCPPSCFGYLCACHHSLPLNNWLCFPSDLLDEQCSPVFGWFITLFVFLSQYTFCHCTLSQQYVYSLYVCNIYIYIYFYIYTYIYTYIYIPTVACYAYRTCPY